MDIYSSAKSVVVSEADSHLDLCYSLQLSSSSPIIDVIRKCCSITRQVKSDSYLARGYAFHITANFVLVKGADYEQALQTVLKT